MNPEQLERCMLSTTPFISLRTDESEAVIRLMQSPVGKGINLYLLAKVDGALVLYGGHVAAEVTKEPGSLNRVVHHLSTRLHLEAGWTFEVMAFGTTLSLSELPWGQVICFIGCIELCRFVVRNKRVEEFSLSLLGTYSNALVANVTRLMQDSIHSLPYATNEAQSLTDAALKLALKLPRETALVFETSLLAQKKLTVLQYCTEQPQQALDELTAIIQQSPLIKKVELLLPATAREQEAKVFSTESSGRELRIRSGLEVAALLNYHIIFIILPFDALFVSPSFIWGLLEQSVVIEGSLESFWNRYKFVNFERFQQLLETTVKSLFDEHITLRKHHGPYHRRN